MTCAIEPFSLAHHWRNCLCANDDGRLREIHWRNGRAIGFPPLALLWRIGAKPPPRVATISLQRFTAAPSLPTA